MGNTTLIILIIVAVVAVVAIAAIAIGIPLARRKRSQRLREQFGPEYDRAVERSDNPREAESELRGRAKRHEELELRSLTSDERAGFERRWLDVQGQFVDDPGAAVRGADHLVVEVMSARGYPVDDFDQRADDLSVSHPTVTQEYRKARSIAKANHEGRADTEQLRHAVTSYRTLVEALLTDDGDGDRSGREEPAHRSDREPAHRDEPARREHHPRDAARSHPSDQQNGQRWDGHESGRTPERETERETRS